MSMFGKRLDALEDRKAVRDYMESRRQLDGRSRNELLFFSVYGYFHESLEGQLPQRQEFTVGDIRPVITTERVSASGATDGSQK